MDSEFANGPWDLGSIPGHIIPKTLKIVLDSSLHNTQQYKVWSNPGKGVVPFLTFQCCSYWKGSLLVANFTLLTIVYLGLTKKQKNAWINITLKYHSLRIFKKFLCKILQQFSFSDISLILTSYFYYLFNN